MEIQRYANRRQAGAALALRLDHYQGRSDVIVLALPRGGVPVAYEVARRLGVPLDVFVVRKLGLPGQPELAMGAIASGGVRVRNEEVLAWNSVPAAVFEAVARAEQLELERRELAYREGTTPADVKGRVVLLVDDGIATGSSMEAAARAARVRAPARIVIAAPVAAADTCQRLEAVADEVVCLSMPTPFYGVGAWYDDFTQTDDAEVRLLLRDAAARSGASP